MSEKTIYQVSYFHIYPDCTTEEDDVLTAFVSADSFEDAADLVRRKYKKEYQYASIRAIAVAEKVILLT